MSTTPDAPSALVRAAAIDRDEPVRAWTPLGTIDAGAIADVDDAGWVRLRGAAWSLDWWVGAEDRWHQPAREVAVRQTQLDDSPIVETSMRVPGGDVVQRAAGVRASSPGPSGSWDDSAVLVEVDNATAVPVALALVLRPFVLDGAGWLPQVDVQGAVVRVDGRVALVLSRPVARVAAGRRGEVVGALSEGRDQDPGAPIVLTDQGAAEVALVVPLPHSSSVRAVLPRIDGSTRRRRLRLRPTEPAPEPAAPVDAPSVDALVAGWARHTERLARVELSEPLLDPLLVGAQRSLTLSATDDFLARAGAADQVAELLARSGAVEPLEPLARALVQCQRLGGVVRLDDGGDASAALLFAAATLLGTGSEDWEEQLLGPVAKVVHRARRGELTPAGSGDRSLTSALRMVADPLRRIGQPEVAEDAELAGRVAAPTAGTTTIDVSSVLDRARSLRARLGASQGASAGALEAVEELMDLARLGRPGRLGDRYDASGTPSGATGHDPGALAARALAVLDLAVQDGPDGVVLLPGWVEPWWGRPVEVHGVVTSSGVLSYALRWHGDRPALLWELEPRSGTEAERIPTWTAPALDPAWRGEGRSGEALLAPVPAPDSVASATTVSPDGPADTPSGEAPGEGQSFL